VILAVQPTSYLAISVVSRLQLFICQVCDYLSSCRASPFFDRIRLYCLVIEAHRIGVSNLPRIVKWKWQQCSEKMWGPLIYEYPPLNCLHSTRTVVIIDILLRTRAYNAHYYCSSSCLTVWGQPFCAKAKRLTKSFPLFHNHYFNISGLLPCCKRWIFLCFCGGPCSFEHVEHAKIRLWPLSCKSDILTITSPCHTFAIHIRWGCD